MQITPQNQIFNNLYAPIICRFFSPDPFVQAPEFTQGFNRYSYCLNNPLKYVDPSGELWTNFEDENGNFIFHVEDGSNAVFRREGTGINKHYEFNRFDENQMGKNIINLMTALHESQNLNNNNSSLTPSDETTYCNYATQNILKTMSSAIRTQNGISPTRLLETGMANTMTDNFATNPLLQSITETEAYNIASKGGFVLFAQKGTGHGHVGTLAVGENFVEGQTTLANIGRVNGFLELSKVFPKTTPSFYTFTNDVHPLFLPKTCSILNWFH
jgi:hypothetical protein